MVYALFFLALVLAVLAVYASTIGWLWFWQERVLFEPTPLPHDHVLSRDPDVHELTVDVPGARLSVLHLKLARPRGVVFYLRGNSGNLHDRFVDPDAFRAANFDVVMFDYRGYGKSTGQIESEAQLRADVRAVWARFEPQYTGNRIVISGQSLGTALAAGLAAELCLTGQGPDLTLLVSPYSSMRALADELSPWVPRKVLRYPLHTAEHALRLRGPLTLIHGDCDELIGIHHSEALRAAVPHAELLRVAGAGHGDLHLFPGFAQAVATALGSVQ